MCVCVCNARFVLNPYAFRVCVCVCVKFYYTLDIILDLSNRTTTAQFLNCERHDEAL